MNNSPHSGRHLNQHRSRPMHRPPPPLPTPSWSQRPVGPIPPPPVPPNFAPPPFLPPNPYQHSPRTFQSGFPYDYPKNDPNMQNESVYMDFTSSNQHDTTEKSTSNSQDQDFVDKWLRKRRVPFTKSSPLEPPIKINELREKLNIAFRLIKELENGARTLSVMAKTVSEEEWEEKCKEIEAKKGELTHILSNLQLNEKQVNTFKQKLSKRTKKRERLKRQAEKRKQVKEEQRILSQNLHIQIDNWQKEMQESVEKVKREEELQKEADAVLWGVTQKKTEARRQISLLSALLELRQVRVKRLAAAGQAVSQTQVDSFNTVIEMLKKSWTKHLEECALEEHALRGMLTKAEIQDDAVKRFKKLVLQEWERAIFGSVGNMGSNMKSEELVEIRHSWDRFIVSEETPMSSMIPSGWVLPVAPSGDDWHKLLKY